MKKKIKNILKFWWVIPILISLLACYSTHWVFDTYEDPSFEQILFHLTEPIVGFESTLLYSFLIKSVLISIVETAIIAGVILFFEKRIKSSTGVKILKGSIVGLTIIIVIICLYLIGFFEYLVIKDTDSTFIEDNYVHPMKVDINFPDKKRNLIYIYAESLESSYLSVEEGGLRKENLLPELTVLAKENISFSDTNKIGGAYELNGTTWTTAAMISQTAGIPLKLGKSVTNHLNLDYFLGGVFTLGDLLFLEGYSQTIMFGSDGDFGNRETYFSQHGYYDVLDYYDAIEKKRIPKGYEVFWGFEDSKLFDYAKEELTALSKEDKPFNFTLLTVNTHSPEGYLEESCPKKYKDYYSNVIACSSYQINEFIKWCMEQDFYENTTIVLTGDHLSMSSKFFNRSDNDERRIFNTFINSPVTPVNSNNREFSTMDMFPTTLASLGAEIEGNRLGLGTNLFSEEETLIEKYGFEEVNDQIRYKSDFYNEKLLLMDIDD